VGTRTPFAPIRECTIHPSLTGLDSTATVPLHCHAGRLASPGVGAESPASSPTPSLQMSGIYRRRRRCRRRRQRLTPTHPLPFHCDQVQVRGRSSPRCRIAAEHSSTRTAAAGAGPGVEGEALRPMRGGRCPAAVACRRGRSPSAPRMQGGRRPDVALRASVGGEALRAMQRGRRPAAIACRSRAVTVRRDIERGEEGGAVCGCEGSSCGGGAGQWDGSVKRV
jgi:hypothetical protein